FRGGRFSPTSRLTGSKRHRVGAQRPPANPPRPVSKSGWPSPCAREHKFIECALQSTGRKPRREYKVVHIQRDRDERAENCHCSSNTPAVTTSPGQREFAGVLTFSTA